MKCLCGCPLDWCVLLKACPGPDCDPRCNERHEEQDAGATAEA
jgi:hypothetical protein